jgi:hypothetical protein
MLPEPGGLLRLQFGAGIEAARELWLRVADELLRRHAAGTAWH